MQRLVIHSVDFIWLDPSVLELKSFKQSVLKLMLNEFGTQTYYYKNCCVQRLVTQTIEVKWLSSQAALFK